VGARHFVASAHPMRAARAPPEPHDAEDRDEREHRQGDPGPLLGCHAAEDNLTSSTAERDHSHMRMLSLLALVVASAACGGDDERPATFSYIYPAIIVPNCATSGCHSGLSQTSGVDFTDPDEAYIQLTTFNDQILLGEYKDANQSYLPRMPPDQPLPAVDILLIQDWILAGWPK
jgi:hypothetical protein